MYKKSQNIIISLLIMLICTVCVVNVAKQHVLEREQNKQDKNQKTFTIKVAYSTDVYEPYLSKVIAEYQKEHENITIQLKEYSTLEYMNEIESDVQEGKGADIYITESKYLQNLVRIGVAEKSNFEGEFQQEKFAKKAIESLIYKDNSYGYPLGFDTTVLMYHKDRTSEVPKTFTDMIKQVQDNNLLPEELLLWDKEKILHNYGFIGYYANVGGKYGDLESDISLNTEEIISAGATYQQLCQCFEQQMEYEQILQTFAQGTLSYAVVDSKALTYMKDKNIAAGFCNIPDLTENLKAAATSVTDIVVVNTFSEKKKQAENFAKYISLSQAGGMMESCHVLSAALAGKNEENQMFYEQYEQSVAMPKLMSLVDYWNKSSDLLKRLRTGEDSRTVFTEFHGMITEGL